MSVLLLRPKHKVVQSQQRFQQHGIDCVGVALQQLFPSEYVIRDTHRINWQNVDKVIFTSAFGAKVVLPLLPPLGNHTYLFAIGHATLQTLGQWTAHHPFWCNGHQILRAPPEQQTSEGLLGLPQLQSVAQQHIVIVKGVGGRSQLATTLQARRAIVSELISYERIELTEPFATHPWQEVDIKTIIATSGEQLSLAFSHFTHHWLTQCRWVVVSPRLAQQARELGIDNIAIAKSAADADIIASI